jgi:hypothetical protein
MEQFNYRVEFEPFTERHYIKNFRKEYKEEKWLATERTITAVCERMDNMLLYNRADLISIADCYKLVKLDFAVEGTCMSPKASGNRCILFINEDIRAVKILLVYSKNDISPPNETQKWKSIIKGEYKEIGKLFGLQQFTPNTPQGEPPCPTQPAPTKE